MVCCLRRLQYEGKGQEAFSMIPRISMLTLGVSDLEQATAFYRAVFGVEPHPRYAHEVAFFALPGAWLALYPRARLLQDIGLGSHSDGAGLFGGVTLAYGARSVEEVQDLFAAVKTAGAQILKAPQETFWGGYGGYFLDPDDHVWEIAWGPMFSVAEDGSLQLSE
jgi:catechol 2,3-dioxygenase-like lactoylglutathione lyase family enzyme